MTTRPPPGLPPGIRPITGDDAAIAAALEDVSIPTLLVSLVHLTGDLSPLETGVRPHGLFLNEVQGYLTEDEKAAARRYALDVIRAYRDRGCTLPPPPDAAAVRRMMSWLVCEDVPEEYVPLVLDELQLDGRDSWAPQVRPGEAAAGARADLPVLVIGCGESGLLAGVRLKQAGFPFSIVEKNAGPGGTWWENRYPGARVDVGNHFYSYSFEPSDHWTEYFAQQPELQAYFERVLDRHGIGPHVRWNTEVTAAAWDEPAALWRVTLRGPDGGSETVTARAVISAVGMLNRPHLPDIPGMDRFTRPAFHSARWPADLDVTGRRVALVGAGASGFQIAPTIAPRVARLDVYQRTAQWMFPNPNYHEKVGPGVRWALRHLPYYGRWYRFLLFWPACDSGLAAARIDPKWDDSGNSVSDINEVTRQVFTDWISRQVKDPDLLAKVIPDYPATGKRTLQDNGSWLQALQRDNVELIRDPIREIDEYGVVTADGRHRPCDVIVYATGFQAGRFLAPLQVTGRDGRSLAEIWGARPSAYLGITIPGVPNFFCMYGPGTNLAHGGSLIFNSECQIRYIVECLDALAASGERWIEVRPDVYDDYYERTQRELAGMVWGHPAVKHSYYKDADGRIHVLSPWRIVDYWRWTKSPDLSDFVTGR